ncbi:Nif3-like dinuclear metal center hexameric protein [PVC group bacterium]|nr:Nif3-like dinuclear metal center hexameric protein [PVC group bacterium]
MSTISRDTLVDYLNRRLLVHDMDDFMENGLQVEGTDKVSRVALAVDASLSVFKKTFSLRCQMLLTHHGLIWGSLKTITGLDKIKIEYLIKKDLNLYSVHLPLDCHPTLGNNIKLAKLFKLKNLRAFGEYVGTTIGYAGELDKKISRNALKEKFESTLHGPVTVLPFGVDRIKTIGFVSGAASEAIHEAARRGLDCFCTGEARHQDHHLAMELGLNVMYLGHYHSETLGVKAVGKELEKKFRIKTVFIDEPTIV